MPKQESIFYHVPLSLLDQLMQYRTKHSKHRVRYKFRTPMNGYKYSWGGALKRSEALTASIYVDKTEDPYWQTQYWDVTKEKIVLRQNNQDLLQELLPYREFVQTWYGKIVARFLIHS